MEHNNQILDFSGLVNLKTLDLVNNNQILNMNNLFNLEFLSLGLNEYMADTCGLTNLRELESRLYIFSHKEHQMIIAKMRLNCLDVEEY